MLFSGGIITESKDVQTWFYTADRANIWLRPKDRALKTQKKTMV
jgi:hypothetical protein